MPTKVLLVGELNPRRADRRFALYPRPAGCAGARLCQLLGLTHQDYLHTFGRVNLTRGRWTIQAARQAATRLSARFRVLLGARVTRAHGIQFRPFLSIQTPEWQAVILPHPSGRSRLWNNSPERLVLARRLVFDLVMRASEE